MAKINVPKQLSRFTCEDVVELDAPNIGILFEIFTKKFPEIRIRLIKPDGEFNSFVNIYVNDEDIRFLNGKDTILKPTDEVTIVPAIAGG